MTGKVAKKITKDAAKKSGTCDRPRRDGRSFGYGPAVDSILRMQRTVGNNWVQRWVAGEASTNFIHQHELNHSESGTLANALGRTSAAIVQQKCACSGTPGPTGECDACRAKREKAELEEPAQRKPADSARDSAALIDVAPAVPYLHRLASPTDASGERFEREADHAARQVVGTMGIASFQNAKIGSPGVESSLWASQESVQRAPVSDDASTQSAHPTSGSLIADDDAILAEGQMHRSDFLAALNAQVCQTAESVLSGVGRSTNGCPYLAKWFGFYRQQDSSHIERAINRYAPESVGVISVRDYIGIISNRVRQAVATWAGTGKVTGVPEGLSLNSPTDSARGENDVPAAPTPLQRKERSASPAIAPSSGGVSAAGIRAQLGAGRSLDSGVRSRMGAAFGVDFSSVRVHSDPIGARLSNKLRARAFTVGNNIAFGLGEYRPGTIGGDLLIAHELAHVVQQGAAAQQIDENSQSNFSEFHVESMEGSLESDAEASTISAGMKLWQKSAGLLSNLAGRVMPSLRSGLKLQRCTGEQCPNGYSWQVVNTANIASLGTCHWACRKNASSGPTFEDPNARPPLFFPDEANTVGNCVGTETTSCFCQPLKDKDGNILANTLPRRPDQDYTGAAVAAAGMTQGPYRPPQTTDEPNRPAIVAPARPSGTAVDEAPTTPGGGAAAPRVAPPTSPIQAPPIVPAAQAANPPSQGQTTTAPDKPTPSATAPAAAADESSHVGASSKEPPKLKSTQSVADAGRDKCVGNVCAIIKNQEEGKGPETGNTVATLEKEFDVNFGRLPGVTNPKVATPARAVNTIEEVTGWTATNKSNPVDFATARLPGSYAIFTDALSKESHVVYARIRPNNTVSILDATVGRGWSSWSDFLDYANTNKTLYGPNPARANRAYYFTKKE